MTDEKRNELDKLLFRHYSNAYNWGLDYGNGEKLSKEKAEIEREIGDWIYEYAKEEFNRAIKDIADFTDLNNEKISDDLIGKRLRAYMKTEVISK